MGCVTPSIPHNMTDAAVSPPTGGAARAAWLARLLLAACLAYGSEILLWNDPLARTPLDLLLLSLGYVALAALLLDLLTRWRVRDLFGLMTVAGVYGLLSALLLNPAVTLFDAPRTVVSRVMGAHTLLGLEMLVLFLALTGGRRLRWVLVIGAGAVGLAWGAWVRWSPMQYDIFYAVAPFEVMLLLGVAGLALILMLTLLLYRQPVPLTPDALRLSTRKLALAGLVGALLAFVRLTQAVYDGPAVFLTLVLLLLCLAILWFRRGTRLMPVLAHHFPLRRLPVAWAGLALALFFWAATLMYHLPLIGDEEVFNQGLFVVFGFTLYGLGWLPTVSLVLGARAYIRQVQATPL